MCMDVSLICIYLYIRISLYRQRVSENVEQCLFLVGIVIESINVIQFYPVQRSVLSVSVKFANN